MNEHKSTFLSQRCLAILQRCNSTVLVLGNSPSYDFQIYGVWDVILREKKVPKGDSERKNEFFLCRWIPLPSSSNPLGLEGFGVLIRCSSQRHHILIWKKEEKVNIQILWSCPGWLWLISVLFWCFGCHHFEMGKTQRYQHMSPCLKGSLHFWLFCLFLAEFCSGSVVKISTLPGNLLYFWAPFFFLFCLSNRPAPSAFPKENLNYPQDCVKL